MALLSTEFEKELRELVSTSLNRKCIIEKADYTLEQSGRESIDISLRLLEPAKDHLWNGELEKGEMVVDRKTQIELFNKILKEGKKMEQTVSPLKKKAYLVWRQDAADVTDTGNWDQYESIEDAVSDKGPDAEVFVVTPRLLGKFKKQVTMVKVSTKRVKKNGTRKK